MISQPARSGSTITVPDALRGGTLEGPDVVTALLYETGTEHALPPTRRSFTLGSASDRDIAIPSPWVSAHHCRLDRRLLGLRVTDQGSKNGTYFEGTRETKGFYLPPGKTFVVGALPHRFLALNEGMRACHPALIDIVGEPDDTAACCDTLAPRDVILAAVRGDHMLIVSEDNCGQDRLARIIHEISRLRARPIVELNQVPVDPTKQLELIQRRAARSTLVLDLGDDDVRLPSSFIKKAFSRKYQVRVIALARSIAVADEALGERYARRMQPVWLRPIASRPEAIGRLLDRMFVEHKSPLRMSAMTADNQRALRAYRWPRNFASLREVADRLATIISVGSIHKAAHELDIPPATLYHWYSKTMGLSRPLVPSSSAG
jgi:hypothetical protein